MTEKKTFKNVSVYPDYNTKGWTVYNEGSFSPNEWDMEVTFTKKPKPFNPGDRVHVEDSWYHEGGTVLVQYKEQVVVVEEDDSIQVYDAADLVHS